MRSTGKIGFRPVMGITCLLVIFGIMFFLSCSPFKGYAVILWAKKDWPYANGDIANISKVYEVDKKYIALKVKDTVELPQWRVMFFDGESQAKEFAKQYKPFTTTFARCRRNGLPVREQAATSSERVTKLRSGEIVKVIEKDKQEKIGNMDDFWYLILTDRGYLGYTYGYYLDISADPTKFQEKTPTKLNPDSLIEALLDNTWIPTSVDEMINSGMIDLDVLKQNYGIVLDQEEKKVTLTLPGFKKEYSYINITKTASGKLSFDGTDLKIEISPSSNKILADYVKNGKSVKNELVIFDRNLNRIIRQEQKRRNDLFAAIINTGNILTSSTGGIIHLSNNWGFTWENTQGITPQIIPEGSTTTGKIGFKYFLSFGLRTRYDGAITFFFSGSPGFQRTFVYTLAGNTIRLMYVPESNIENQIILRAGATVPALDFQFSKE